MSEIKELIERLSDTQQQISYFYEQAEKNPDSVFFDFNLSSLRKREKDLERKIQSLLHSNHQKIIEYRVKRESDEIYTVDAVASSMKSFQELFTAIYDALKSGPKKRFRPSAEIQNASAFEFAGARTGSVILSFTLGEHRRLTEESDEDRTLYYIQKILNVESAESLKEISNEIGVAAITKTYALAKECSRHGIDADISWGLAKDKNTEVLLSASRATELTNFISDKSDEERQIECYDGNLVGFDGETSYFHIITLEERESIKGQLSRSISKSWTTDATYRATISKTVETLYATGQQKVYYTLLSLEPLQLPYSDE